MSRKQRVTPLRPPSQRQLSRRERERRLQRAVIVLAAVVLALVIAIPAYGYYREVYARGFEPIARVNDRTFTINEYVKRMLYQDLQYDLIQQSLQQTAASNPNNPLASQQLQQLQLARASLGVQAVEDMVDDEVVAQSAPKLGITVTPDDVSAAIKERLLGTPKEGEKVDEAKQQADVQQRIRFILDQTGLTEDEYRGFIRADHLRQKLDEYLRSQVPTTTEQVHIAAILIDKKEEADQVHDRLVKGEDFAAVAKEKTLDAAYKDKGGDMGWLPRGIESDAFDKAAFELQIGQISEPVQTDTGYYILKLLGKETREIEADRLQQLQGQAFGKWLNEEKKSFKIERYVNSDKQLWATDRVTKERQKRQQRPVGQ